MMKKMGKTSIQKRIKITKRGKVLRRVSHQGHNQAKESPKTKQQRKKNVPFLLYAKQIKRDIF
jgi:ribosomal protein L35